MDFRALIVDDEETYARSLERLLGRRGVPADRAGTSGDALAKVRRRSYDLVVLDYLLPDGNGLDLIPKIRALRPPPRVLMMTAFGTIENAVEAMRRGAYDYVTKSTALDGIVERVLDARKVAAAGLEQAEEADTAVGALPGLLGESPGMRDARQRIAEVAAAPDTTVLLTGESGTGKGVAARAIHHLGGRRDEPFVVVDCVALPPSIAEGELFGHDKGAFPGADRAKPGRLEICGKGTLFLDEIGDMDPALQGKFLRALEERTFERIGGVKTLPMAARVVAASHRDLGHLVEEKRFRLDLYHRLMVFPIALPALRSRGDDVLLLAEHFLAVFAGRLGKRFAPLGPEVQQALRAYGFPGNVRELKNVIERAAILSAGGTVDVAHLPERVLSGPPGPFPADGATVRGGNGEVVVSFRPGTDTLDGLERRLVEEALRLAGGKKSRAAEMLGISRFALMRRLEKHHLQ